MLEKLFIHVVQIHNIHIYVLQKHNKLSLNKHYYLSFPLAQAERGLTEGDGRTVRSAGCLRRGVVVGAPTKPTTVAVPVTNPTRESERGRMDCVTVVQTSLKSQTLTECRAR